MTDLDERTMLLAKCLRCRYGEYNAVDDISIQLKKGEVLGLLGPNGAGKTTTIRMITGNLAPNAGSIKICGIDLLNEPQKAKARLGYLPEIPPLYFDMTVDEYLRFAARLHRMEKHHIPQALETCKQRCGLMSHGKRLIGSLSKGLQQRIGIAQAIIHDPDVIILDEPTVGLDPNQMREIRELIRELGKKRSIMLSTHLLLEVESVCSRVQIMHEGQVVMNETVAGLKQQGADLETVFTRLTQQSQEMH